MKSFVVTLLSLFHIISLKQAFHYTLNRMQRSHPYYTVVTAAHKKQHRSVVFKQFMDCIEHPTPASPYKMRGLLSQNTLFPFTSFEKLHADHLLERYKQANPSHNARLLQSINYIYNNMGTIALDYKNLQEYSHIPPSVSFFEEQTNTFKETEWDNYLRDQALKIAIRTGQDKYTVLNDIKNNKTVWTMKAYENKEPLNPTTLLNDHPGAIAVAQDIQKKINAQSSLFQEKNCDYKHPTSWKSKRIAWPYYRSAIQRQKSE